MGIEADHPGAALAAPTPASRRATAGGIAAIVLWSATVALARSLSEHLGSLSAAAAVTLTAGACCALHLFFSRRGIRLLLRLPAADLLICGGLFAFYMAALFLALGLARSRQQVLEVGLLNYLWPALTILFSLIFLKKKADARLIPGTLLALAGVYLVLTQADGLSWPTAARDPSREPLAYALGLAAAFSWALYSTLTRRWIGEAETGAVGLFLPITGLFLLVIALVAGEEPRWTPQALGETLFLGVTTAAAYALWEKAMRKGDLIFVAACSYFTPLLSTAVSCLYLSVAPGAGLWIGCLLLVGGSILSRRSVASR